MEVFALICTDEEIRGEGAVTFDLHSTLEKAQAAFEATLRSEDCIFELSEEDISKAVEEMAVTNMWYLSPLNYEITPYEVS